MNCHCLSDKCWWPDCCCFLLITHHSVLSLTMEWGLISAPPIPAGFWWIPLEWLDSCRNRWGTVKYWGIGQWEGISLASEGVSACGVSPHVVFLHSWTVSVHVSTEAGVGACLVRVGTAGAVLRLVESIGAGGTHSDSLCSPAPCASASGATGPARGFLTGWGLIFCLLTDSHSGSFVFASTGSCAICGSFLALPFLAGTSLVLDPPFLAFPFEAAFATLPFILTAFSSPSLSS